MADSRHADASPPASEAKWVWVALITAATYAAVGWLALNLALPEGYASPLFPSAGIALAATLVYGRRALPGVLLGSFVLNIVHGASQPMSTATTLLPLVIAFGATLQAAAGASLVRRFVSDPLVLNSGPDIIRAGLLGGLLSSLVSASVATLALLAAGQLQVADWPTFWATWWVGDLLGLLIGTPLALTLIGRPRADWQPRRRSLGVPLLLALALLATAVVELRHLDDDRLRARFERDADRMASEAQARLRTALYALQALHSVARGKSDWDQAGLAEASRWWLNPSHNLLATGYSALVPQARIAAFEALARTEGLVDFHVFSRDGGKALANDGEAVVVRQVEPRSLNASALGVNALSIPAARAAILATRRSGEPSASAPFELTQLKNNESGLVLYQALYAGAPADEQARQAAFRALVFVTLRTDVALANLASEEQKYLHWCVVDPDPAASRRRLAGPSGCDKASVPGTAFASRRVLALADREFELQLFAPKAMVPGSERENTWLLTLSGLSAAALFGAFLLIVTGHTQRTERAVKSGTASLRREIDERTQVQQALLESEARLRSILNHVPIGVMFLDPGGRLIDCNPRLCEMLGQSEDKLRGRSVADISHPDEAAANRRARRLLLAGRGDINPGPMRLMPADGRTLWVRASTTALRDSEGRVHRLVGVVEDITEHLRLEKSEIALHRAEASNRAKSEFVSRMSHELRTPLNAMIGFAQLLGLDHEPGLAPHQREWTTQIQRAGWHLLDMINETLDLARIEAGAVNLALKPVALEPLLAASTAMVCAAAAQRDIVISEQLSPAAPTVLGDATRLKQVMTNLLSNAVKYNRKGGTVSVTTRTAPSGQVEILVSDTGLGMTELQLKSLFQPYNRLGREGSGIEGTGIGLVISRRLSELMGGTLAATSQAGRGSVFTLRLLASAEEETPTSMMPETTTAPYRRRSVHYIEDNETNIEVMRGVLAQRPQIVLGVSTMGLDGLAAVRQQRPDLILLDMQLPDISGLELLRHLKNDDDLASIPVIVVSADATADRMEQALTLGAAHYVTKPVEVARFLFLLDEVLDAIDTRWGM